LSVEEESSPLQQQESWGFAWGWLTAPSKSPLSLLAIFNQLL
jgi:hypothetical protein